MFGRYSYLTYMLIFTIIPIVIIWIKELDYLKKNVKIIAIIAGIAIVYQLIADPFAEIWKTWFFTKEKILGVWLINFPIENTIFLYWFRLPCRPRFLLLLIMRNLAD